MRVLLSGTSNSILAGGFHLGISSHPSVSSFTNRSLGASGVIAVGHHLCDIDFSNYDVCILDYHVNETVNLYSGVTSLRSSFSDLSAIIDAASRAGCLPVIAIFPLSRHIGVSRPFDNHVLELLSPYSLPIFNLYSLVDSLASDARCDINHLFLDPNHLSRALSRIFGSAIIDVISQYVGKSLNCVDTGLTYNPLHYLDFSHAIIHGNSYVVNRKTRLISSTLLNVSPGTHLALPEKLQGLQYAGMSFNASRSWGAWHHSSDHQIVIESKYTKLFTRQRELTLVSQPFSCASSLLSGESTFAYHPNMTDLEADNNLPLGFEFSGIILRDTHIAKPLHIYTPLGTSPGWNIPSSRYREMLHYVKSELAS